MVAYSCAASARWWPSIHLEYAAFFHPPIHNIRSYPKGEPIDPFYLNLGATTATGFAFLSSDRSEGRFLVD